VQERITYVGLDAHQETIHAAVLLPGIEKAAEDQFANTPETVRRWARRVGKRAPGRVVCGYEAGPLGYGLMRELEALGLQCIVVAPALIPYPPTPEQEAVRDLSRARGAVKTDQIRQRHRLSKFLLRRGVRWTLGRKAWTNAHLEWLRGRRLEHAADQAILDDHLLGLEQIQGRLSALDAKLEAIAQAVPYQEPVGWLRCFRGIDTLTALACVAELHDWRRFDSPRALMAYLGLVPSESSSGGKEQRGAITKAGNVRLRRLLVEAAWHYRHRPGVSYRLRARRAGQPARVIAIADRAQQRLHARYTRLQARGKAHNKIVVAVGRELAGFLWAAMDPKTIAPIA